MHRLGVAATVAVAALIVPAPTAGAGGGGGAYTEIIIAPGPSSGAYTDDGGAGSSVSNDEEPKSRGRRRRSSASRCVYEYLQEDLQASSERIWGPSPGGPGTWSRKICYREDGRSNATIVWLPRRPDPPRVLAERAERYLPLPAPVVSSSPSANELLVVGLDTWLWVDPSSWEPQTSTVSVTGVSVTVVAVPERVVWQMGDGGSVVCSGPGRPYDPAVPEDEQHTDCSYRYATMSARQPDEVYEITATIEWQVTWDATGAPGGGDMGVVRRTSAPVAVRVGEVQAVNVRSQQGR